MGPVVYRAVETPFDAPAVRAARPEDLPAFVELLEAAGTRWWGRGVRQWEPGSQRAQAARLAGFVKRGALLLAHDAEGLAAGAILTAAPASAWKEACDEALYVRKLAVAERLEGQGVGLRLLARLGALARREGAEFLRLDCWDGNARLRAFYRGAGMTEGEAVPEDDFVVRRFEHRLVEGPLGGAPLPLAEPVPRIPPPPRRTPGALPPYRYVPGRAPHPVRHPQGHARAAPAPDVADLDPAQVDRAAAFLRGADLFDAAYWWEAHEAWEALWVALGRRGREAQALQGLIQVAAACLKRFAGERATARRLAERGLAALGPRPAGLPGLDAEAFAKAVRAYVRAEDGRPPVLAAGARLEPAGPPSDTERDGERAGARETARPAPASGGRGMARIRFALAAALALGLGAGAPAAPAGAQAVHASEAESEVWARRLAEAQQAIEDARAQVEEREAAYARARHDDYPRGEALAEIEKRLEDAREALREAEARLPELVEEARRDGVLPEVLRPYP